MSSTSVHDEWLSLIEISGPFFAIPVLKEVFPQGLEELEGSKRTRLRQAYEEWREALETDDPQFMELHAAWIDEVLSRGLELDEDRTGDVLKRGDLVPASLRVTSPEHGVTLAPDFAVVDSSQGNKSLMIIQTYAADVDLEATMKLDGWAANPAERMVQLCRLTGCRIGLVTNGERWMLVDAPVGAVTTFASWYARIWSQEPITLQAFVHLLGIRRFFFDESEQLPALFDRSLKHQDEVTEALGEQVRRAVEVLIQSLDKADLDRNRELLCDVAPVELYEAGLTVMMRLVFLLSAEERGLLLLGDERYEANYALSTLRMKLRIESEEILERRWDAWSRLLAIFRAVFGGVEHENLRLPALGGSLFDPDRFPFLEGRAKGSKWRTDSAKPLPIDNRTVLLLLEAIQQFQGRTLSYRALDVEQIGYVYEGLLERTVKRTDEVTLELDATKSAKTPWVKLAELESVNLEGGDRLIELLLERSGSSASRIRNDLAKPVDDELADRLLTACHGELGLRNRIKPYAHLLRIDPWGYPLIYPKGAFIVTTGSDRRETGTHYTPKSLTETIVTETLTPVAYVGPAEGKPRDEWVLKSPAELLELKICDPAMGSGAFLVQSCRWLSDRLVEAWSHAEGSGQTVSVDGEVLDALDIKEPLPRDTEARTVIARRLIAERCLYGVDLNPLAVELAKLSIWLVTLAKGRPFGFLDHNLRYGDSLLGIHHLDQLTELSMTPGRANTQMRVFGRNIEQAVHEAIELRQRLREMPIRDIHDVEAMARLDADARRRLEVPGRIADALIGEVYAVVSNGSPLENSLAALAVQAGQAVDGDLGSIKKIVDSAAVSLSVDLPSGNTSRRPLHWPLEFPEVFSRDVSGFSAIVGNPPFLGGKRIAQALGEQYVAFLKVTTSHSKGAADLCAYFFRRVFDLIGEKGAVGLLATNTISQADTREVGLDVIVASGGTLFAATSLVVWPGSANVHASIVHFTKQLWSAGCRLDGRYVNRISAQLMDDVGIVKKPHGLKLVYPRASGGTQLSGIGFVIEQETFDEWTKIDTRYHEILRPYINGKELNSLVFIAPPRYVINFEDRTETEAEKFPLAIKRVRQLVKPKRDVLTGQIHETCYWKHWDKRPTLYASLKNLTRVLVCSFVSKHLPFTFLPAGWVYSKELVVFPTDDAADFSVLQSTIHAVWVRHFSGTLKSDLSYSISDGLRTFAIPTGSLEQCRKMGEKYWAERKLVMEKNGIGMTTFYNRFHDPADGNPRIDELREIHRELDLAVARAYGWGDFNFGHGFHPVPYLPKNDRVRFTISEPARIKVLRYLSELNQQRYEDEVAQGLHGSTSMTRSLPASCSHSEPTSQDCFDFGDVTTTPAPRLVANADADFNILDYLRTHGGWHAKSEILSAISIRDGQWNTAISDLIARGDVVRQGERRGTQYRAVNRESEV